MQLTRIVDPTMATNLQEMSDYLTEEGIKHQVVAEHGFIRTFFKTENYRDQDGDDGLRVIVLPQEDGEFVKVFAPNAYICPSDYNSFHRLSLFQTLLYISWMTKMVQFEYDPDNGEIRPMIEFPLEDAKLTRMQLVRCVGAIVQIIDQHHESIQDAIKHGLTPESPSKLRESYEEFLRQRRSERRQQFGE